MEKNEISEQEVRIFLALWNNRTRWMTNKEIADLAAPVSPRTVRAHTLKLVKAQLIDQAEVFPGHRYRLAEKAEKRNRGYLDRLHAAVAIFGLGEMVAS